MDKLLMRALLAIALLAACGSPTYQKLPLTLQMDAAGHELWGAALIVYGAALNARVGCEAVKFTGTRALTKIRWADEKTFLYDVGAKGLSQFLMRTKWLPTHDEFLGWEIVYNYEHPTATADEVGRTLLTWVGTIAGLQVDYGGNKWSAMYDHPTWSADPVGRLLCELGPDARAVLCDGARAPGGQACDGIGEW